MVTSRAALTQYESQLMPVLNELGTLFNQSRQDIVAFRVNDIAIQLSKSQRNSGFVTLAFALVGGAVAAAGQKAVADIFSQGANVVKAIWFEPGQTMLQVHLSQGQQHELRLISDLISSIDSSKSQILQKLSEAQGIEGRPISVR